MSKSKKKVPVLTDEQYNAYIMSLKYDAASYNADGSRPFPDEISPNGKSDEKPNN
ncbi:MAG: hypothetical protein ACI4MH_03490 [Candidatus Coproplasma sp.]